MPLNLESHVAFNLGNTLDHLIVLHNNVEVAGSVEMLGFKWLGEF